MGKRIRPITPLLLLTFCIGAGTLTLGAQSVEDYYWELLGLTSTSYLDNAGLTVFPVLNLPLGGEDQGFAGVNTSTARDVSFLDSNPAAGPLQTSTQLTVQTYNIIGDINMESVAFTDRFTDLSLGGFVKFLHTPFGAVDAMGDQIAASSYVETVAAVNVGYTFLRNYYFSGISIGANVKLAYRMIPSELYQRVTGLNGTDQSVLGVMGDFGILTRFNFLKAYSSRDKNFSLGAALLNLGPPATGDPLPTNARFGITYQPFRFLLVSGDLKIPINLVDVTKSEAVGFGFATALQFVNFFNIKAGFYLDNGFPKAALGARIDLTDIAFDVSYTLDLSSNFSLADHMSVQASFNLGDNGRTALEKKVDNLYVDALVAMGKGEYARAMDLCTQALKIDPGFVPAQEHYALAKKSLELEQKLENIQLLPGS